MIKYKRRASVEINSSSMADIAFLLLIFFLVTTTISMDQGIEIVLPSEGEEMKVNKNNITVISINESGKVLFNKEDIIAQAQSGTGIQESQKFCGSGKSC